LEGRRPRITLFPANLFPAKRFIKAAWLISSCFVRKALTESGLVKSRNVQGAAEISGSKKTLFQKSVFTPKNLQTFGLPRSLVEPHKLNQNIQCWVRLSQPKIGGIRNSLELKGDCPLRFRESPDRSTILKSKLFCK